jgi:cytochrome c biogenesis protein
MQISRASFSRAVFELISSMRFAISLLTVLAIASVIGTVLQQNQPYSSYQIEFGPFWFRVFAFLGLYDVYHAGWFILILAFLVVSTGFCIYRQTPLMWREMKSFREHATEASLRSFSHQVSIPSGVAAATATERLTGYLAARGYRFKVRESGEEGQTLIAAKKGSLNRLGYMLTHGAIVMICIGGLIDSNIPLKVQELIGWKKIETRDIPQIQVPPASRLAPSNLSFRGSVSIPEGSGADVIFLNVRDGYLVQELPFLITLRKFRVEHYATGQPKTFESDLTITDYETGRTFDATIAVNHPLVYKGIAIYQASFGDGGSRLTLNGWNLFTPATRPFPFKGVVNQTSRLSNGQQEYAVEVTDFRLFNIQDFGAEEEAAPKRAQGFWQRATELLRGASSNPPRRDLRNVGPSVQYKIRDAQGQAHEYHNYMQPIRLEGRLYFLSGVRAAPNQPFRYLRMPADDEGSIEGYMGLRAVVFDKALHPEIGRRFAEAALQGQVAPAGEAMRAKLAGSTAKVLDMFADGGFDALAQFIEKTMPQAEHEKAAETYLRVLERALVEAYQLSRERAGKKPAPVDAQTLAFVRDSLNAINDSFFYGAPVYLQLAGFEQVQASGLQLTRSPGKNVVYGGSVLLVLGVFAMFYIRERRIWLLVKPGAGEVLFAMAANRKTVDFENEFATHRDNLPALLGPSDDRRP